MAKNRAVYSAVLLGFIANAILFCPKLPGYTQRPTATGSKTEFLTVSTVAGTPGGTLFTSRRSDVKTFNPLVAVDAISKEIIALLTADLIHVNRHTQQAEPALASSWELSSDGRQFTVHLRRGIRFSDGQLLDADDVVFTIRAHLDEKIHSTQRDFLVIDGKPITFKKNDSYTIVFTLPRPQAAVERLFDSIAILPRHLLERAYSDGKLSAAWSVDTPPAQIAGLGPFRLQQYVSGQQVVLERNPFYWKIDSKGNHLPYVDRLVSVAAATPQVEEIRFQTGALDLISRFDPEDFSTLEKNAAGGEFRVVDVGPGLEYSFLLFNMNDLEGPDTEQIRKKQKWFRQTAFRQAVSSVLDRDAIVRLAYAGRAYPLAVQISPGNRAWLNSAIPRPARSLTRSKQLLRSAGFSWNSEGILRDASGSPVEFSIIYNSARPQQARIVSVMQQDLKEIGIGVNGVPMDHAAVLNRTFDTFRYETAIMTIADGDTDPNTEMNIWLPGGQTHVWKLRSNGQPENWEREIEGLMREQMVCLNHDQRKRMFDRVQEIIYEQQPVVFLVSPDILAGARNRVGNFQPGILSSYTLWNAEELFIRPGHVTEKH